MITQPSSVLRQAIWNHYYWEARNSEMPPLHFICLAFSLALVVCVKADLPRGITTVILTIVVGIAAYMWFETAASCKALANSETDLLLEALRNPRSRLTDFEWEGEDASGIITFPKVPAIILGQEVPVSEDVPVDYKLLKLLDGYGVTMQFGKSEGA